MIALFPVLWGREDRLMILVLPSVKDSSSSMSQAAQMTSGKTVHSLWALIFSFLLVQRGFVKLNIMKNSEGLSLQSWQPEQNLRETESTGDKLFFPNSKKTLTLWKQIICFHNSKSSKPYIYLQVRSSCKRTIQIPLPAWHLTPSLSAGREGRSFGIMVLISQTS